MKEAKGKIKELDLLSVIGYSGSIERGLHAQETGEIVYPVGHNIGVWDWKSNGPSKSRNHALLKGHSSPIVALSASLMGDIVVSAENGHTKEWATVIIWSLSQRKEIGRHSAHREEVTAVSVGASDKFVASLGGETDGKLIIWDSDSKKPICSTQACEAGHGAPKILRAAPKTPSLMAVGGRRIIKVFSYDEKTQKFTSSNVNFGLIERHYTDLQIDSNEEFMYGSTTTGDIVKVRLNLLDGKVSSVVPILVALMAPKPFTKVLHKGVIRESLPAMTSLYLLPNSDIIVGDSKGIVRGFVQDLKEDTAINPRRKSSRAESTSAPTRAHGSINIVRPRDPTTPILKQVWSLEVSAAVTSLSSCGKSLVVGTEASSIYEVYLGSAEPLRQPNSTRSTRHKATSRLSSSEEDYTTTEGAPQQLESQTPPSRLLSTCPSGAVYDIAFPKGVSDLVVTVGDFGIRVWNVRSLQELLSVTLPGIICKCCVVSPDLSVIITGWIDGRIRGVGAESGVLKWAIEDAHQKSVNSLVTHGANLLISGGADGRVRSWRLSPTCRPTLLSSVREHRGEVTSLTLDQDEMRLLSCGGDGQSVLWKAPSLERLFCLKADSVFLGGSILCRQEIVTVGSDGCVLLWDSIDGALLADLRISRRPVTAVDVTKDDKLLVTAEESGTLKVWHWLKGRVLYEGLGHSSSNTSVKLSPDGEIIVSAGVDGCVFIWKAPKIK